MCVMFPRIENDIANLISHIKTGSVFNQKLKQGQYKTCYKKERISYRHFNLLTANVPII